MLSAGESIWPDIRFINYAKPKKQIDFQINLILEEKPPRTHLDLLGTLNGIDNTFHM